MKKLWIKKFFLVFGSILLILLAYIALKISMFRLHTVHSIKVESNNVTYQRPKTANKAEKISWDNIPIVESEAKKVTNITIYHEGEKINSDIYEKDLRYYLDFESYVNQIGGNIRYKDIEKIVTYNGQKVDVNPYRKIYSKEYEALDFRGEILDIEGKEYISLNDIESMFNLKDTWDTEKGIIYVNRYKESIKPPKVCKDGKGAFIRIEDVTSGSVLAPSTSKEKMKILADNFYSKGARFHIAWVPRYKNPQKGIDNDLLINKTIDNVQFINMLDHIIQRGGIIGLHGYTHQSGNDISLEGFELTRSINSSEEETRNVIESAITTAKTLRIPIGFFETPHYGATRNQQKIIEEYFNVLYEPYTGYYNANPLYSFLDENRLYMPTMFGYVKDKNGQAISKKIEESGDFVLKSMFVHPYKELGFIDLGEIDENGYREYKYNQNSPLNNILKALSKKGYIPIGIDSF